MERPERYDPEDIEHLMLERSFDELLEEEKAYVLRHLQDSAEYGRMRALLLHMQETGEQQDPIDADPAVREHVLQAFREHQRPQWRIWLNSVAAFLVPARPVNYWRPALALGALALFIVTSLSLWNTLHGPDVKVLAETRTTGPVPELRNAGTELSVPAAPANTVKEGSGTPPTGNAELLPPPPAEAAEVPPGSTDKFASSYAKEAEYQGLTQMEMNRSMAMDSAFPDLAEAVMDVAKAEEAPSAPTGYWAEQDAVFKAPSANNASAGRSSIPMNAYAQQPPATEDALLDLLRAAW